MPWRRFFTWLLPAILLCLTGRGEAAGQTVTISFAATNAPYAWASDGQVHGLEFDIMSAVLALSGYRLEAVARPYARLSKILANEKIDGVTGQHPSDLPGYYFSQPYMSYSNYAIVRKDSGIALQDVGDLLTRSVVAWRGAAVFLGLGEMAPQRFAAAREKTYLEFADQPTTFKYFWNRRAEVLLSDRYIYETYLREHPDSAKEAPAVTYLRVLPENVVQAAFKSREVRDAFDQGLRRFKETGAYQRLVDSYFN